MSKMNDMAMTIEELRNAAAAINDAANWLAQQFSSDVQQQTENIAANTDEKARTALTLEEVRAVLADKSRAIARGQQDHRRGVARSAQPAQHVDAAAIWQHDVEQDHVIGARRRQLLRLGTR